MTHIAIVLGYGVYEDSNTAYKTKYLEPVLTDILAKNPDLIITCAGCSNSKFPTLSEAESIKTLFVELQPSIDSKIITETDSLSTPESLEFTSKLINKNYPDCDHVTIYVDSCRVPKALYLSLQLFLTGSKLSEKELLTILGHIYLEKLYDFSQSVELNYQNITVVGTPLSDNMTLVSQQIVSSMLEMHSFNYPELHQEFIDWRKKQWGIKTD
ncbi:hypothetical protein KBC75_05445 [Candidatus Shapirobacteria bacterium]|nr:hypothetical protein [Candidatus Shapirobacteria bacterium]